MNIFLSGLHRPGKSPALLVFVCFLLACVSLSAQEEPVSSVGAEEAAASTMHDSPPVSSAGTEGRGSPHETAVSDSKYNPRERKIFIDIPLTIAEIMTVNLLGNFYWRLWGPDSEVAYFTIESIKSNLKPNIWTYEEGQGGDTFLTNNFIHPYAGGIYFASARSNNFSFYESILFSFFGSTSWEILGETLSPSFTDMINSSFCGIALGEVMHRLFRELDKKGTAGRIGATIVSPTDRITAAVRGYGPDESPSRIHSATAAYGLSWLNSRFFENNDVVTSWNVPTAFIDFDLVYEDPYTAQSMIPFEQFDLFMSLAVSVPLIYNFNVIASGYLASWCLADNYKNQISNGLTLHWDGYFTDKGSLLALNSGRENLNFNPSSLDYTLQWRRIFNKSEFSLKTHLGFTPWAMANYNGGANRDDLNLYLMGGNFKLFMELQQMKDDGDGGKKNGQALALNLCFFDTWRLHDSPHYDNNTLFLFSKITYSFPLTDRHSIYAANSFQLLYTRLLHDEGFEYPNIMRWHNNTQFGIKITL
ncbi:MAG: DUF3943 domain-containing protein [Treponema sp.]|jgi:hypothetical protein|nr:DUF3943 domain-containing protein [Treponema sp.]